MVYILCVLLIFLFSKRILLFDIYNQNFKKLFVDEAYQLVML